MRYLSPAWLDAAAEALAGSPGMPDATRDVALTLEQTVTDGPDGTVTWHVVVDHGEARLAAGPAERADLSFTTTYPVARAIALGELPAPMAFIAGRLRVGGDLGLLTRHQKVLSALDDVLAEVRKTTTFDSS